MASREVTRQDRMRWLPVTPPPGDIWQGYQVNRTVNGGIEITLRTSKPSHALLWIGLAVAAVGLVIVMAAVPAPGPRDYNYSQGGLIVFFSILVLFATSIGTAALYAVLPEALRREFALETIEIRPDGVTINRRSFFGIDEVFNLIVKPEKGVTGDYRYACQGIVGTRQMVHLRGLDEPTATVLAAALEQARRMKWAAPEFDD